MDTKNNPYNISTLNTNELSNLCSSIRNQFIEIILENGGHFAGNLGVVELTASLLHVFNPMEDSIIWDVGHQSYIYKMLTGRADKLSTIRQFNGLSGFPKMDESPTDAFGTGHSSTALSAAMGIATAKKLNNNQSKTIALVGDGALTGGMAWEALNNMMSVNTNLLLIINDNHIGIDPNNGAIDKHLQNIENYAANIFQNFNIPYTGPIDGHNLSQLIPALEKSKKNHGPQILHVRTIKGKGYKPAEEQQTAFHATAKYVKINTSQSPKKKWQDVFGEELCNMALKNEKIVAITPAMPSGSGLINFMKKFPTRSFDVGIAEQHALTFAAGLATQGLVPFVNIYSTFLQRAYDQFIHDIALQNLPVVLAVDRAGLVGEDGPTHHGSFDIAYLLPIPNTIITAPANKAQFCHLLQAAQHTTGPFIIRYPKGNIDEDNAQEIKPIIIHKEGAINLIISVGEATNWTNRIDKKSFTHIQLLYIKPLDKQQIINLMRPYKNIIIVEDGSIIGGIGQYISSTANEYAMDATIHCLGIPDEFATHGSNSELYAHYKLSPEYIASYLI